MCIQLLLDGMFYICPQSPFGLWKYFKYTVSLLILFVDDISIVESGILKFPTIIVLLFISSYSSITICLEYLGAPVLGVLH